MKIAIFLSLLCLAWAAPKAQKTFQDHFEEFLKICVDLEGKHFSRQTGTYLRFPEYRAALNAIDQPIDFNELAKSFEQLPEYRAVINFLAEYSIDVSYFVKRYEEFVGTLNAVNPDQQKKHTRQRRHPITGTTIDTSVVDTVSMLPRRQLRALFAQKMAYDESFRRIIEAIRSDEFQELYQNLWANRVFRTITDALSERGLHLRYALEELMPAFFGQNIPTYVSFQMQFDEFLDIIVSLEGAHFMRQFNMGYKPFPEFIKALDYVANTSLINYYTHYAQSVPEFIKADTFLRQKDVFIAYHIDRFELLVKRLSELITDEDRKNAQANKPNRQRRHPTTGTTLYTCIVDTVSLLPRQQLRHLFDYKMATNEVFQTSIKALRSEEWKEMYKTIWKNEEFISLAKTLADHDLDLKYIFEELAPALFGQNTPIYFSFQNQFDEFLDIIVDEAGDQFYKLVEAYINFPEFKQSLEFVDKSKIMSVYQRLGRTAQFNALDVYLKQKDIFVPYYLDRLEFLVGYINSNATKDGFGDGAYTRSSSPASASGSSMSSFLSDFIKVLPKAKLNALYEQKLSSNKEFITAIEAFRADEYKQLYNTVWETELFKEIAGEFSKNDFDLKYLIETFTPALYGQN
ncbi:unnamed protein product [Leptosia nina]|uniref:Uncharacterized protein n=1 Tax=Leptosia nina TaxID=320188 RepID=A0AAV1JV91_9NEOP